MSDAVGKDGRAKSGGQGEPAIIALAGAGVRRRVRGRGAHGGGQADCARSSGRAAKKGIPRSINVHLTSPNLAAVRAAKVYIARRSGCNYV
jgi:hypothetical protein